MKIAKNLVIALLITSFLIGSCSAVSLQYWDAYSTEDLSVSASQVFYSSVPLVGKVISCETTADQVKAATALVYGHQKWNNTSEFDFQLPFSLSYLYFNTTNPFNVAFISGTLEWLQDAMPGFGDTVSGYTIPGALSTKTQVTYEGVTKSVLCYAVSGNSNAEPKTKIGILNTCTDDQLKVVGAHELGHALGWVGHSSNTSQLMHFTSNYLTVTSVGEEDIRHIGQIYSLYYNN